MTKFKKWCIVSLAFILLFSMVGCNKAAQESSNSKNSNPKQQTKPLLVFSGAGLKKPMDEIGKVFEEKYGVKVQYTYAGAGQNLSQIALTGEGDVFTPGDISFYETAKEQGLVDSKKDIAYHVPIIAVPADNPANIQTLEDLAKPGVKIVLGDPQSAAIGRVSMKIFEKKGILDQVQNNVIATTPTVNELVSYVSMKQADASIIWEDNAKNITEIKTLEIPKEQNIIKTVPISLITKSTNKEMAQKFIDFVTSDEGKSIYKKHGFQLIE
jgi:molybdate transport system substrate-binding protein